MKTKLLLPTLAAALLCAPIAFAEETPPAPPAPESAKPRPERPGGPGGPGGDGGHGMRRGMPERPKFEDIDANKDGSVTQEEFVAHAVKQAEERATEAFGRMDANKDGKLDETELKPLMGMGPRDGERPRGPGAPDGAQPRGNLNRDPGSNTGTKPKRPAADAPEA